MKYSHDEIREYVRDRRERLVKRLIISGVTLIASAVLWMLDLGTTPTFIGVAGVGVSLLLLLRALKKYPPKVLWSREITGVNIKEHEYVESYQRGGFGIRSMRYGNRTRSTRSHLDPLPTRVRARVYLRLEDGDIYTVSDLYRAQTDVYEDGDTLIKYEGTRYPVIVGREVKRQPCPICGTVNTEVRNKCSCGLSIID